jgi:hypothetical protein
VWQYLHAWIWLGAILAPAKTELLSERRRDWHVECFAKGK